MLAYGNQRGLDLLEERECLLSTLAIEKKKTAAHLATHDTKIKNLENQVQQMSNQMQHMSHASNGYLKVRQRFLSTYRRDVLGDVSETTAAVIRAGNRAAHDGDAVCDAGLYETQVRRDESIFIKLYGMRAAQVTSLSNC